MLWFNLTANLYSYLSLCEGLFWTLYLKWWNSNCADNKDPHSNTPALSDSIECRINITKNKTSNATPKHSQGNDASEHKNLQTQSPQGSTPAALLLLKMYVVTKILPPFDKFMSVWKIKHDLCWGLPANAAHTDFTANRKPLREITQTPVHTYA